MQRVTVLENGFAWRGKTYPSLSKVALAITGTRWNGPRGKAGCRGALGSLDFVMRRPRGLANAQCSVSLLEAPLIAFILAFVCQERV
jgi:hypothetical protein